MFKSHYTEVGEPKTELVDYVRLGGFPATHLQEFSQDEVYTIVRDIYNSTIFSDIVKRNQVRKIDQLERVVKYTFNNVGNTFSAKSISDYLKAEHRALDNETVYSYLEKLEKAYLLHRCSRFDLQGKEILKTQEKFYLADTALRYSVLGYNAGDDGPGHCRPLLLPAGDLIGVLLQKLRPDAFGTPTWITASVSLLEYQRE